MLILLLRRTDKRCHRNANPVAFELAIGFELASVIEKCANLCIELVVHLWVTCSFYLEFSHLYISKFHS